jgi:hypothetical protein
MSNYGGLALWQTALADSILGYVAQVLKLLLGWGLALKDALVDEIRDVVHYVFAHPSRCAKKVYLDKGYKFTNIQLAQLHSLGLYTTYLPVTISKDHLYTSD